MVNSFPASMMTNHRCVSRKPPAQLPQRSISCFICWAAMGSFHVNDSGLLIPATLMIHQRKNKQDEMLISTLESTPNHQHDIRRSIMIHDQSINLNLTTTHGNNSSTLPGFRSAVVPGARFPRSRWSWLRIRGRGPPGVSPVGCQSGKGS